MERNFQIRDLRKKEKFVVDDFYLNGYAKLCGVYATAVYLSLCRHADREQKSFPSLKRMAEEHNISVRQVSNVLKILEFYHLIKRERIGKKANNRYYLIDKSEWTVVPITMEPYANHHRHHVPVHSKETHKKETHSKDCEVFKKSLKQTKAVENKERLNKLIQEKLK